MARIEQAKLDEVNQIKTEFKKNEKPYYNNNYKNKNYNG